MITNLELPSPATDFLVSMSRIVKSNARNQQSGGSLTVGKKVGEAQNKSNVRGCNCKKRKQLHYWLHNKGVINVFEVHR